MKQVYIVIIVLLSGIAGLAQPYGNEWIELDQPYWKMAVAEDGVYELGVSDLQNLGINTASIDPRSLQIWRRGQELAIDVEGETDGVFSGTDRILFYGKKQDGVEETQLYSPAEAQAHDFYSLYSDTSYYFLTWGGVSGKRMESYQETLTGSAAQYHNAELLQVFTSEYSLGDEPQEYIFMSWGDFGEGFFGNRIQRDQDWFLTFDNIDNRNTAGGDAQLEIQIVGKNRHDHVVEVIIGELFKTTVEVDAFEDYRYETLIVDVPEVYFNGNNLQVQVKTNGVSINPDDVAVSYAKLTYAQDFVDKGEIGQVFNIPAGGTSTRVEIPTTSGSYKFLDISDDYEHKEIGYSTSGGGVQTMVKYTDTPRKLVLWNESGFKSPTALYEVNFVADSVGAYDYLMITDKSLMASCQDYADYRASTQGGSYRPYLVDAQRILDQYGYGETNPVAIRRYCDYMMDKSDAKYLVLIGQGNFVPYRRSGAYYRHVRHDSLKADGTPLFPIQDHVMTMGAPGSDIRFSNYMNGAGIEPALATGRISAYNSTELENYLDKVKEHEALGYTELWRKNLVHLSGGKSKGEASVFKQYVENYAAIAAQPNFGAVTEIYTKSSNDVIEFFNIAEQVNKGVSMVTYFGHSAPRFIEIEIGNVSDDINGYANKGKYPFLFMNGCHAGEVFIEKTRAEDWMFEKDKGAIGAFGHSSYGYSLQLDRYCERFYELAFENEQFFGETIGNLQKELIADFIDTNPSHVIYITQSEQFLLLGDPAIRLFSPDYTDYETTDNDLFLKSFTNDPITAQLDSFEIGVGIRNYGKFTSDSFEVCVTRTYGNGTQIITYEPQLFPSIGYQDTVFFKIANNQAEMFGLNRFEISIDCKDSIPELNELNNSGVIEFYFPSNGLRGIFPREFSVVPSDTVKFVAQSLDLFIDQNTGYYFELDTAGDFQFPLMTLQKTSGALVVWEDIVLPHAVDSLVYYWRVRFEDIPIGEDTLWATSSLMYIEGKEGWAQGHFPQFYRNGLNAIYKDDEKRKWHFDTVESVIQVSTAGEGVSNHLELSNIRINDQTVIVGGGRNACVEDGLYFLAVDNISALPFHPFGVDAGDCGLPPKSAVSSTMAPIKQAGFFVEGGWYANVPDDDYMLIVSVGNSKVDTYTQEIKDMFTQMGVDFIDSLDNGEPFIVFAGKNGPVLFADYDTSQTGIITMDYTLTGKQYEGTITSPLIGPASEWNTYYQDFRISGSDEHEVEIRGVRLDDTDSLFITFTGTPYDSLNLFDSVGIDPLEFPYLELTGRFTDTTDQSAPQLEKWLVLYQGVPEGTINTTIFGEDDYSLSPINEGDSVLISVAFQNISDLAFSDTLIVRYTIINQSTGAIEIIEKEIGVLGVDDTLVFAQYLPSLGLGGDNSVQVFVNPKILAEQYYDNNVVVASFGVVSDDIHPVLDVVFDGKHILDGDIVSPSPYVTITFKDDNTLLHKQDTVDMELFIKAPCETGDCQYSAIYFSSDEIVNWIPASATDDFRIEYNPQNLSDGVYTLRVQGVDASGNKSGAEPYEISFEVINESSITHFYPYPNPFSTSARFVYTLTGSEVPEQVKIQIMTVSGRVVKEISQDELGPLTIGNSITDYAWDGKDEYGDQLANGVYLYRVIVQSDGETLKRRETSADKAFDKEFGKLYILR